MRRLLASAIATGEGLLDAGPDGEALVGVPQYAEGNGRNLQALATRNMRRGCANNFFGVAFSK